jgi:hypothetical protein
MKYKLMKNISIIIHECKQITFKCRTLYFYFLTTENIILFLDIFHFRIKSKVWLQNFVAHFWNSTAHWLGITALDILCSFIPQEFSIVWTRWKTSISWVLSAMNEQEDHRRKHICTPVLTNYFSHCFIMSACVRDLYCNFQHIVVDLTKLVGVMWLYRT